MKMIIESSMALIKIMNLPNTLSLVKIMRQRQLAMIK